MAFCTQCGNGVGDADAFCGKCGARQNAAPAGSAAARAADPTGDVFKNVSARNASVLCYIPWVGWIAGIVVLASPRFQTNRTVRFHAFQGIYLFVTWLIVDWVLSPMFRGVPGMPGGFRLISGLLHAGVVMAWIFMIVKTSQEQLFRLPLLGELAERSVEEQR